MLSPEKRVFFPVIVETVNPTISSPKGGPGFSSVQIRPQMPHTVVESWRIVPHREHFFKPDHATELEALPAARVAISLSNASSPGVR